MEKTRREEIPETLTPTEAAQETTAGETTVKERAVEETAAQETTAEETGREQTAEKPEKKQKKEKRRKNRLGIRTLLRILQHAALAVMVFSMLVITVCSTVQVSGVHSTGGYTSFTGYSDPGIPFEESELFNAIFGYAVADIIRFGVVSSQMETGGAFDGDKIVDVTAYNHRNDVLPEQYVTANYRLEDLLKWQNYGFSYSSMEMTETAADGFLADVTRVTSIDPKSGYQNTADANYLKSDVASYTSVNDVPAGQEVAVEFTQWDEDSGFVKGYQPIGDLADHADAPKTQYALEEKTDETTENDRDAEEPVYAYDVLVNRYKTAEGRNLEEYVSDWTQYYELCDNVRNAAENLAFNYKEYMQYTAYYDVKNSNVRFLVEKPVGDKIQYYSNMADGSADREQVVQRLSKLSQLSSKEQKDVRLAGEKFIYYSPADMTYLTNTSIAEDTVRKIMQSYDYAYPETARLWISVDTSYPAKDAFTQGAEYLPHLWLWVAAAVIAGFLYLALFVYQTVVTGRVYDEKGEKQIRLNAFDELPTEAAVLVAFAVTLLSMWILVIVTQFGGVDPTDIDFYREAVHEEWFKIAALAAVFAGDVVITFFFYSLIRRIKARTIWKNSYLSGLVNWLKQFAWKVYDNSGIVLRTWVPYGAVIFLNLAGMGFSVSRGDDILLFFLAVIDVIVGILLYKDARERQEIVKGIEIIAGGQVEHQIDMENLHGDNKSLAASVNSIGKGIQEAVEISMKDERMKADLITNVSHDIKTPLTSIINYVDLLKREQVESEKAQGYIRVLDEKSQRLKQLTDDLVEASKITSGTISLHFERIDLTELMNQTIGEFSEKFEQKGLVTVMNVNTRNVTIEADSRRIWRVMENLFNNIYKYAMPGTRVYVTLERLEAETESIQISLKNISENYLNCKPEELTERFIRGDESRTTEGSGLGLSIAKNLTLAQKGSFEIELDGDLFKVILTFPAANQAQ